MGSSGSTPKTVTVEMDQENGTVKISEAVVQRMIGEAEPQETKAEKQKSQTTRTEPDEAYVKKMEDNEKRWKEKLRNAELKNAELYRLTSEQFAKAAEEVESKFIHQTYRPICKDLQEEVLKCYSMNPKEMLNCTAEVRAFTSCVEETRNNLLTKKEVSGKS
ncbi:MICOS complex subunit MIC19-like [Ptychodera flava]|uniref:MICOS complex subunit MIC19-like n=1 Tax=Ptychodera flava TaxID=63121 RepID=UPI00396A841C